MSAQGGLPRQGDCLGGCLSGGCLPGGYLPRGASAQGEGVSIQGGVYALGQIPPPLWTEFLTQASENISFL